MKRSLFHISILISIVSYIVISCNSQNIDKKDKSDEQLVTDTVKVKPEVQATKSDTDAVKSEVQTIEGKSLNPQESKQAEPIDTVVVIKQAGQNQHKLDSIKKAKTKGKKR